MEEALKQMDKNNIKKIILDLRTIRAEMWASGFNCQEVCKKRPYYKAGF